MGSRRVIDISAINIILHPHSFGTYVNLFHKLFVSKKVVRFRGIHGCAIGALRISGTEESRIVLGTLYKFVNVSPPWFDADRAEPIVSENGEKVHLVARHQKSNLKEIPFVFFPGIHRFFFSNRGVSARTVRDSLQRLCAGDDFSEEFGEISISIETSSKGVSEILALPTLNRIEIHITKPNPAGLNKFSRKVLQELDEQNAERLNYNLGSRQTMQPNENTQTYMQAARSLGRVVAVGKKEDGKPIIISTDEYPLSHRREYDANAETSTDALINCANEMAILLHEE